MILNTCVRSNRMVDERICKDCQSAHCRHAGAPTTAERLDMYRYGTASYWAGETDDGIGAAGRHGEQWPE